MPRTKSSVRRLIELDIGLDAVPIEEWLEVWLRERVRVREGVRE